MSLIVTGAVLLPPLVLAQSATNEAPVKFAIAAQPLGAALDKFSDVTGHQSFYDTNLVRGRRSGRVQGVLAPREALDRLLVGTDLSVRRLSDGSFVLLPQPSEQKAMIPQTAEHRQYYAFIQNSMRDSFCRSETKWEGQHRFVALFWIEANGAVRHAKRLGPTLGIKVDQRIEMALHNIRLGAPPVGFEQPVLIMVVPRSTGVTLDCEYPRADTVASGGVE